MGKTKQVIVMRTDLNMRKGKMIAQGSHASIAFLTRKGKVEKIVVLIRLLVIILWIIHLN